MSQYQDAILRTKVARILSELGVTKPEGVEFEELVAEHIAATNNPHGVTKTQVGLGSVQNYGVASQIQAEVGESEILYMTPLRVKQSIQANAVVEEVDPTVPSHVKGITTTQIVNWNAAYAWGNHALEGYAIEGTDVVFTEIELADQWILGTEEVSLINRLSIRGKAGGGNIEMFLHPVGTATYSRFEISNNPNLNNYNSIAIESNENAQSIISRAEGSASLLPLQLRVAGDESFSIWTNNVQRSIIDSSGITFTGNVTAPNLNVTNWNTAHGWGDHAQVGYALDSALNAHTINVSNPHSVTKIQVGLGSVENYAIATETDATTGTSNVLYMTPLRVAQAIDQLSSASLAGLSDTDVTGVADNDFLQYNSTTSKWEVAAVTPGSSPWTVSGSDIYYNDGNVGIGATHEDRRGVLYVGDDSSTRVATIMVHGPSVNGGVSGIGFSNHGGEGFAAQAIVGQRDGGWGMGSMLFLVRSSSASEDVTLSDEVMRLTHDGNVGIGTSSPDYTLDVRKSITGWLTRFRDINDNGAFIGHGSGYGMSVNIDNTSTNRYIASFGNPSGIQFYIRGDGNVGIGIASPSYKLDITGGSVNIASNNSYNIGGNRFVLYNGNTFLGDIDNMGGRVYIREDGQNTIVLDGQNVGIGTSSPSADLEVNKSSSGTVDLFLRNTGTGVGRVIAFSSGSSMNAQLVADNSNNIAWVGSSNGGTNRVVFKNGTDAYFDGSSFGFNRSAPLNTMNNNGVHIDYGGHTMFMLGDGVNDGGVIQCSDNVRRLFLGVNVYDDVSSSWSRFTTGAGVGINMYGEGTPHISFLVDTSGSGYPSQVFRVESDKVVSYQDFTVDGGLTVAGNISTGRIDSPTNNFAIGIYNSGVVYFPNHTTTTASANCFLSSDGRLYRSTSSSRFKTNVRDLDDYYPDALTIVEHLRPVLFDGLEGDEIDIVGFIAEEVERIVPQLVTYNNEQVEGLSYDRIPAINTLSIQQLHNKVKDQQYLIENLEAQIANFAT